MGRSGLVLTAWVLQWRGRRRGSRGGGGNDVDLVVEELRRGVGLVVEGRQRGSRGGGGDDMDLAMEELRRGVGLAVEGRQRGSCGGGGDGVDLVVEGSMAWVSRWSSVEGLMVVVLILT
jgi:hypothetical protein